MIKRGYLGNAHRLSQAVVLTRGGANYNAASRKATSSRHKPFVDGHIIPRHPSRREAILEDLATPATAQAAQARQRLHGSFVSEKEVTQLVEHLRAQGAPKFDDDLVRLEEILEGAEGGGMPDEEADEHYDLAVQIVAETRNASISYIQRRLKVGYNRAARMIEQMEREGVVGPQVGTRPREVFVQPIGGEEE